MSTSHHGQQGPRRTPAQDEVMKRLLDQFESRARREWSQGRINSDDEGDLAMAVTADKEHGVVILDFGKPVKWVGLPPQNVAQLVEMLIKAAREVAKEPFSITIPENR